MLPALIGGGLALAGGLLSAKGQSDANRRNIQLAQNQMNFQERMSNTSWQRSVADMKMAGINPMLSFMKGGASTPGGQTATTQDVLGPAVNSATASLRLKNEIQMNSAQRKLIDAQTFKTKQEGTKAMAEAAAMYSAPQSGVDMGIPYYLRGQQAMWTRQRLENELIRAGMPAAKVRGSRLAALWQIYGRSIAGGATALAATRFGTGFLKGR